MPMKTKLYIIGGKIHHANNRGISFSDSSSLAKWLTSGTIAIIEVNPKSNINNEKYLKLSVAIHSGWLLLMLNDAISTIAAGIS